MRRDCRAPCAADRGALAANSRPRKLLGEPSSSTGDAAVDHRRHRTSVRTAGTARTPVGDPALEVLLAVAACATACACRPTAASTLGKSRTRW
ncbi:hypothetical protein ACU4GD_22775 [Cupriavidus basilensis]